MCILCNMIINVFCIWLHTYLYELWLKVFYIVSYAYNIKIVKMD